MLARILIRPPQRASNGSVALEQALPKGLALRSRTNRIPEQYRLVVNWGNSGEVRGYDHQRILNHPVEVRNALNKLTTFNLLKDADVRVPPFFTSSNDLNPEHPIHLARLSLTGSGGDGIVAVRRGQAFPEAPLYVEYIPKLEEYRVHVFCGVPIHVQQKRKRGEATQSRDERLIRNHDNGWVFCNMDLAVADIDMLELAVEAVEALGLDFGALDIIRGRDDGEYYVLECNTAPGLDSPTAIQAYASAIQGAYESGC